MSLSAAGENVDKFEVRMRLSIRKLEAISQKFLAPAARHFLAMRYSIGTRYPFLFQGLLFSLVNSISAPEQIPGNKKRARTQIYFSISDGLIDSATGEGLCAAREHQPCLSFINKRVSQDIG